jgi:hypothetical protein
MLSRWESLCHRGTRRGIQEYRVAVNMSDGLLSLSTLPEEAMTTTRWLVVVVVATGGGNDNNTREVIKDVKVYRYQRSEDRNLRQLP